MKNAKHPNDAWAETLRIVKECGGKLSTEIAATAYNKLPTKEFRGIVTTKDRKKKMVKIKLYNGDCLVKLKELPSGMVDMVLVDLPYGTTACPWDSIIPLDKLWEELLRVGKPNTAYVFTCQQPFTAVLASSNLKMLRYELIWEKPNGTSPFQAKHMPMKKHEDILVFYKNKPTYNPQMEEGKPYKWNAKRSGGEAGGISQKKETPIDNQGTRFPGSVQRFAQDRGLHPTQKPVALMEWLINSYTNKGNIVLDCTMGSGTTGVAAALCGRHFVGIEKDKTYFDLAETRIKEQITLSNPVTA